MDKQTKEALKQKVRLDCHQKLYESNARVMSAPDINSQVLARGYLEVFEACSYMALALAAIEREEVEFDPVTRTVTIWCDPA
jgi:hypothetical protein